VGLILVAIRNGVVFFLMTYLRFLLEFFLLLFKQDQDEDKEEEGGASASSIEETTAQQRSLRQFESSTCMTDKLAALNALVGNGPEHCQSRSKV
jgi:hypothetical protein